MTQLAISLVAVCSLLVGCSTNQPPPPQTQRSNAKSEKLTVMISSARKEDIVPIPAREVPAAKKRATAGDLDAINKLIGYYLQHDDDDAEAHKWSDRRDKILANRRGQ